ncbi:MAG: hypothetical protein K9N35_09040 [Candidatus Marinimicrobia bacterium]|nr:hypothetical protein [Candidatus Neomarinimicrobiota bacterium]
MKKTLYIVGVLLLSSFISAQTIKITTIQPLAEWDFISVLDYNQNFGPGSPLLFSYRIDPGDTMARDIGFKISLTTSAREFESAASGYPTLLEYSFSLDLEAPLTIDNTKFDIDSDNNTLIDELGNVVRVKNARYTGITESSMRDLLSDFASSGGNLPEGTYSFQFLITAPSGFELNTDDFESITVLTSRVPAGITLGSPRDEETVSGANPFFEWTSFGCDDYYIRIAEYNPLLHSSPDDAINSESSLPYPDNHDFYPLGNATSLLYEGIGRPLEVGKTYVWQIKKKCISNRDDKWEQSQVQSFNILETNSRTETPCQQQLRNVLGDNQYNVLFGVNGPLEGYGECAEISLDGNGISATDFESLLVQLINGVYEIESVTTQ